MPRWSVYILRCSDNSLYTGIAIDVAARVASHNMGKGAKYTRAHLPVKLVWSEAAKSPRAARMREAEIKKWPKIKKETLVAVKLKRSKI
ncbi:MAG: GIY-YIG nuclease family protein [Patescibacteria group bacterium]